jgi:hypothetical protein
MINRLSITAVFVLAAAAVSHAAIPMVVGQTYNTGYNSVTNAPLPPGANDLYFNLYSYFPAPFLGTPVIAQPDDPAWVQTTGAQWIAPVEDQSGAPGTGSPAGIYDYNAFFATDFLVPTTITMTGSYAADDGATLFVNGVEVSSIAPEAYTTLTPFSYTFTLNAGPSIIPIDFLVNNLNIGGSQSTNPTGLLVSNLTFVANVAPEPGTWALLFAGLGVLLVIQRVRRADVL